MYRKCQTPKISIHKNALNIEQQNLKFMNLDDTQKKEYQEG